MKYYSSHCGGQKSRVEYLIQNNIGCMVSSADWRKPYSYFAVDNGAWTDYTHGTEFNHIRFLTTIERIRRENLKPDFIIIPDVYGNGEESIKLSRSYMWLCDEFPCYLPIQPNITEDMITDFIPKIKGLFIGGNHTWKYRYLHQWVEIAHKNGLKIHVGKVGTVKDLTACVNAGVDSADGSALIRNGKMYLISKYLRIAHRTQTLPIEI